MPQPDLNKRIQYALNWAEDFKEATETFIELSPKEKTAIEELIQTLQSTSDPDKIQAAIFEISRKNDVDPKTFFKTLYIVLFGTSSGPRLGPYFVDMGKENAVKTMKKSLGN